MGENTLVAEVEGPQITDGLFAVSDVKAGFDDFTKGNIASGVLDAGATALDTASAYADPLGTLLSMGAGWLMDHVNPLKDWLNHLTGDAGAVEAKAATWDNIKGRLDSTASSYRAQVSADLGSMSGEAVETYRSWAEMHIKAIETAAFGAERTGVALSLAAAFVETVHGVVRDLIAQLVGHIGSWLAEEAFSLGTATAWVVDQVVDEVADLASKGRQWIHALMESSEKLKTLLEKMGPVLAKFKTAVKDAEPDHTPHRAPGRPRAGGGKKGAPEERRPVKQGRTETTAHHAKGHEEKPLPDANAAGHGLKHHLHNAGQQVKNTPTETGRDLLDDLKAEGLLGLGAGADADGTPEKAKAELGIE